MTLTPEGLVELRELLENNQYALDHEQRKREDFITNLMSLTAKAEAAAARLERAANAAENAAYRMERAVR